MKALPTSLLAASVLGFLGGCGPDDPSVSLTGGSTASFSAPPGELKSVLATLSSQTGWKVACDPALDHELVYLKFKDKTEQEVVKALGQILTATATERSGTVTLTLDSKADRAAFDSLFADLFTPALDAKRKLADQRPFAPGSEKDRLTADVRLLRTPQGWAKQQELLLTPSRRAAARLLAEVTSAEYGELNLEKPVTWATNPKGSQLPMSAKMTKILDDFASESAEWGAEVAALREKKVEVPSSFTSQLFNPRDDLEFTLERGQLDPSNQSWVADSMRSFTGTLAAVGTRNNPFLARLTVNLDGKVAGTPKNDAAFEKAIRKILSEKKVEPPMDVEKSMYPYSTPPTSTFDPANGDIRLRYLTLMVDSSTKGSDNVAANFSNSILWEATQLPMSLPFKQVLDPAWVLAKEHKKTAARSAKDFTLYQPKFARYARMDRPYWISIGNGLTGSRFTSAAGATPSP